MPLKFPRRLYGIHATPVKLDAAPNPVGPRSQHAHAPFRGLHVVAAASAYAVVGHIEIVGLGRILRRQRVDLFHGGDDLVFDALFADGGLAGSRERGDAGIGKAALFRLFEKGGVKRPGCERVLGVPDTRHLFEEPSVDAGLAADLACGPAFLQGTVDNKHAAVGGTAQGLADFPAGAGRKP